MATTWTITKQDAFNIESELNAGLFVEAIKSFRGITKAGLRESKAIIEYRRDWGDWPIIVKIKEEDEELFALSSLPPEVRSVETIRSLLCETLLNKVGTEEINCGSRLCNECSLSPTLPNDDFLINLINLPLNTE